MVRTLLTGGADPRIKNHAGDDALSAARKAGQVEVATILAEWAKRKR